MSYENWPRKQELISGQEYIGNQLVAKEIAKKGYESIIKEYVYIDTIHVEKTLKLIPNAWDLFHGVGIDLGGGVGCISSTIAKKNNVEKIFCVELVEEAVRLCQPIVKKNILGNKSNKVISVVGDFDFLKIKDNSIDFAISWDSMHHSSDPIKTFKECKRILKKNGIFVIVDRAHNNSTSNSEIERILNIKYDEEFLRKNYRPKNTVLTRKENGEHEYRFIEWEKFFMDAGFKLEKCIIIKTNSEENKMMKNDDHIEEIFVDYDLGAFGNRKVAFLLKKE